MKLGHGSHQRTPIWTWLVMLILGAIVLPGAAFVFAQEKERLPSLGSTPLKEAPTANKEKTKTQIANASDQEWIFKTIDVSDLLSELKKFDLKDLTPEQRLLLEFPVREKCDALELPAVIGKEHRFELKETKIQLGGSEPNLKIIDGQLYLFESKEIENLISKTVAGLKLRGFEHIVINSSFSNFKRDELKKLGLTWSVASPNLPNLAFASESSPKQQRKVSQASLEIENANSSSLPVQAASFIEKNYPVFYSTIDRESAKQLSDRLSKLKAKTNISPTLVTNTGLKASVFSGTERPFIVGYKTDDSGKLGKNPQPIVRGIPADDAAMLTFLPTLKPDGIVNLKSEFDIWDIVGVETEELPIESSGKPITIQIPELSTQKIKCSLDIKRNDTMVVGGYMNGEAGKKSAFLATIDCNVVFESTPAKLYVAAKGAKPINRNDMVVNSHRNQAGKLLTFTEPIAISNRKNNAQPTATILHLKDANHELKSSPPEITVLSVTTAKKPTTPQDVSKINEVLLPFEIQIELDGELAVKVIEDTTFISGQDVVWTDKLSEEAEASQFALEAGLFEMVIKQPDELCLKLSKGCKVQIDAMVIEGDSVTLTLNCKSGEFQLEGKLAKLKHKAATAHADHILFSGDSIVFNGNVGMEGDLMENGKILDIRANKVEIIDEEIFIDGVKQISTEK